MQHGITAVFVVNRLHVFKGTPAELKSRYAADTLRLAVSDENAARAALQELQQDYTSMAGELIIRLRDTMSAVPILEKCKSYISSFQVLQGTMDDAFIGITGEELRQ